MNFDKKHLAITALIAIYFLITLASTAGFFADEFQYLNLAQLGPEGLTALLLTIRPPALPLILKAFAPLGLSYAQPFGILLFKTFIWGLGILGAYLLGRELCDENLGWLFALVLGTFYAWVFYSAKVLTDALVVVEVLWLFFFLQLGKNKSCAEYYSPAFAILALGLLTKPLFLAFAPLSALFIHASYRYSLLITGAGFAILAVMAGITMKTPGSDRYLLPFFVLIFLGLTALAYFENKKLGYILVSLFVLAGIAALATSGSVDLPKYGEMRLVSQLNGTIAANMADYSKFYCPSCRVIELSEEAVKEADWIVYQKNDMFLTAETIELNERLSEKGFCTHAIKNGLTIWRRCEWK